MAKNAEQRRGRGDNSRRAAIYEGFISFPGVDQIEGTIEKVSENGVIFSYTRYGSRYQQFFPAQNIVACIGSTTSAESMLWFRTNAQTLWRTGKRDRGIPLTTEPTQYGQHLLKSVSPDFPVVLMGQQYSEIIGKTTGTRGRKKGAGKKTAAEKSGARKGGRSKRTRRTGRGDDWD
jgi:hypothetical protein